MKEKSSNQKWRWLLFTCYFKLKLQFIWIWILETGTVQPDIRQITEFDIRPNRISELPLAKSKRSFKGSHIFIICDVPNVHIKNLNRFLGPPVKNYFQLILRQTCKYVIFHRAYTFGALLTNWLTKNSRSI